jgi:hypothetical protein
MKIFASSSLPDPPSNIYPICAENWSNPGVITLAMRPGLVRHFWLADCSATEDEKK